MATTGLHFWSTTAATNATADSSVNWAEGQAPSSVNDSARALMASAKKTYADFAGTLTTGGSSTAYTLTTNQVFVDAAAMSGAILTFIPHTTSGATPTLAVDGLTARQIRTATGTNVATGALIAGTPYTVTYIHASTEFILHQGLGVIGALSTSSLVVTGTASVGGATTLSSTLGVTGAATFASTVSVGGATTLTGTVTANAINGTALTASGALSGATVAGAMLASKAEMEAASATDKIVRPANVVDHPGTCKAWVKFQGSDGAVLAAYNVASVTKNSSGNYTVNISTDFSSAHYAVVATAADDALVVITQVVSQTAGTATILVVNNANSLASDPDHVHVSCFGDQ